MYNRNSEHVRAQVCGANIPDVGLDRPQFQASLSQPRGIEVLPVIFELKGYIGEGDT